jgi:peptidoglycan/LPS O-acetylase OafA/YrhL
MVDDLNIYRQQKQVNPRIQILRGVAVLLVIFFHLGLPQFAGGFLGVDAFLVISGFFMQQIYSNNTGSHKVLNFYSKRMKRLIPAYLATAFLVLIISFFRFLPHERIHAIEQFFSSALFTSNISYWLGNQYFSAAELRPTLSFWSLALEIQFYLVFPLLFWLFLKNLRIFMALNLFSLVMFILLNKISPETSFFLLLPRLWQFGLGMICSKYLLVLAKWVSKLKYSESAIFRFSVILEIVLACSYKALPFSNTGIYNIIICSLTGVAIAASVNSTSTWKIENWLHGLGNASYSIYLTHLPVIVLLNYVPFQGNNVPIQSPVKFILSLLFTFLSGLFLYFVVEKPFRQVADVRKLFSIYALAIVVASTLYMNRTTLSKVLSDSRTSNISFALMDRSEFRCGLLARIEVIHSFTEGPESCWITPPTDTKYLLIGNSHADAIKTALGESLGRQGISLALLRDNMALTEKNLGFATSEALRLNIQGFVVHSSQGNTDHGSFIELAKFAQSKGLRLIVIGPVPTYDVSIPDYLMKHRMREITQIYKARNDLLGFGSEVRFYESNALNFGYQFINVESAFCDKACKIATQSGNPFYFDGGHLTLTGSRFLFERIYSKNNWGLN